MTVKNAWYPRQMPTKIVVELQDGSFYEAELSPFRKLAPEDLIRLAYFTPAMGDEMPTATLRFYGLTKESDIRLKQLRVNAGLSQSKLAEASGVNIRQIQKIEAGEIDIGNITLLNASKLASALHVSVSDLLEENKRWFSQKM